MKNLDLSSSSNFSVHISIQLFSYDVQFQLSCGNDCESFVQLEDQPLSEQTLNMFNYSEVSKVVFVDSALNEYKAVVQLLSDTLFNNFATSECSSGDSFEIEFFGQVKRIKLIIPNSSLDQSLNYSFRVLMKGEQSDVLENRFVERLSVSDTRKIEFGVLTSNTDSYYLVDRNNGTHINELNNNKIIIEDYSIDGQDYGQVIKLYSYDHIYVSKELGIIGFTHTNGEFLRLDRFE